MTWNDQCNFLTMYFHKIMKGVFVTSVWYGVDVYYFYFARIKLAKPFNGADALYATKGQHCHAIVICQDCHGSVNTIYFEFFEYVNL